MSLAMGKTAPLSVRPTPRMNRRRLAAAIRMRQELQKRATRWLPTPRWRGTQSVISVLNSAAKREITKGTPVLNVVRSASVWPHPLPSPGSNPPDAEAVIRQADGILHGDWSVFEHEVSFPEASIPWRQHPISGVTTPLTHFSQIRYIGEELGGDVKYIWELNRHTELLRLAQAYHLTGDNAYAERALELLADWIDTNPPMRGINWVSALEISFRAIAWCWIWRLTSTSNAWNEERIGKFLWVMFYAARCIQRYDSIHHSPNTHLTGEALGLLYIGTTFPLLVDAERFRECGIDILVSEIPHQFLDDGLHFERSTGYHRYHIEFYLHALAIAQSSNGSWGRPIVEPLERALEASLALRLPDGRWPVLGDEDGGATVRLWSSSSNSHSPLLVLGARMLNRPDLAEGTSPHHGALAWWLGRPSIAPIASSPRHAPALKDAGYYVCRDRILGEDWFCLVDAGPHGGGSTGHAHTDLGHVELFVGRLAILADPGCSVYASNPARRDFYRSLSAHACVQIDGNPLAVTRGTFGWSSVAPTPKVTMYESADVWGCWLSYDAVGVSTVVHQRLVAHVRDRGLVVVDQLTGTHKHDLQWHWPLGHEVDVPAKSVCSQSIVLGGVRTTWIGSGEVSSHMSPSIRSMSYGHEMKCSALDISAKRVALPFVMVTTFLPEQRGAWEATPAIEELLRSGVWPAARAQPTPADLATVLHRVADAAFGQPFTSRAREH
jgi:hypothetical protein